MLEDTGVKRGKLRHCNPRKDYNASLGQPKMKAEPGRPRESPKRKERDNPRRVPETRTRERANGGRYTWVVIPTAVAIRQRDGTMRRQNEERNEGRRGNMHGSDLIGAG